MQHLGEVVLISWAGYGVVIEKEDETTESLTLCVSVPETSENLNVHGEQMAGERLARHLKETLTEMGIKRLTLKYRVRQGDNWTKVKGEEAATAMRKQLYGSQW